MIPPSLAVSIVIPMRNEERRIGRCLDSILANDFPKEQIEILVADGMSTDRSRALVVDRIRQFPFIHIIDNPGKIVSSGLNHGIRQSRGRVIFIMGAHSEYPHDYITKGVLELERTEADVVGGMLDTKPGASSLVAHAIAHMSRHPFGVGSSPFRTGNTGREVDTVPYGAYRREIFDRVGLFNERLVRNQDFEFNARVRKSGGKLFLSPDLTVVYYNVPDLRRLVLQAFNNGLWLVRMWLTSRVSFRARHAAPLVFVTILLASIALSPFGVAPRAVALSLVSLYSIAATTAAVQIALRAGARLFVPSIGVFVAHHVLYGLGTLIGLVAVLPIIVARGNSAQKETT